MSSLERYKQHQYFIKSQRSKAIIKNLKKRRKIKEQGKIFIQQQHLLLNKYKQDKIKNVKQKKKKTTPSSQNQILRQKILDAAEERRNKNKVFYNKKKASVFKNKNNKIISKNIGKPNINLFTETECVHRKENIKIKII